MFSNMTTGVEHMSEETKRHDRSWCAVCGREFWGVYAFDQHRPCKTSTWRAVSSEDWIVTSPKGKERASYKQPGGGPLVLAEEWDLFMKMADKAAKARRSRGKS